MNVKEDVMRYPRRTLVVASIAAAGLALTGCVGGGGGAPDEQTLTVTMWGGAAQEGHVATVVQPWADENGVTVQQDSPTDYAKLDAMVDAGKVSWGVVETEPNYTDTACKAGTLTKLSDEVKQAAEEAEVDPAFMSDCGIPILQYAFTIGYNTEKFADGHPTTWEEFFDTEKFPGKRGFWKYATGGIFEAALLADGVAPEDLYPLDLDRAFAKLDTIKDDIVWYDTGDQQTQLVASGEAPLVQAWNGRITQAAADGQPVANEFGENLTTYEHVVIPQGYPNTELAEDWMVWFLSNPEAQADQAIETGYGPASPRALEFVPAEVQAELAGSEAVDSQAAATMDYGYWAENYGDVTERFNVWMAQ
ncbi:ABC transporter substrate-binding protein [Leucobacter tenebrionis]|uniref:ABC transporter substrate-binding protein n=1 Tax=Leucobacter tenebrionis TaxID=2873270 RepID=UPI001CA725DF|nr:ABC transporter substrate-binding protein [Leucobacter tenebrionis]QZY52676.1 ABC transporter substrate-binding protein [Leucobacter tenebrionis]